MRTTNIRQQNELIAEEHRAWMNDQIRVTLAKKARGKMKYSSLDDVRREFGLDEG